MLSKKYKSKEIVYTGQEIVDNIQKKLADDVNYIYEFRVIDNKPIIKRKYRVSFDNKVGIKVDENMIVTVEDLKSKHVEALMKIEELKAEIVKIDKENHVIFLELIDALGGLYQYASKKKLILMLSKILKEFSSYSNEKGTQYSYESLSQANKDKVIELLYSKVYK